MFNYPARRKPQAQNTQRPTGPPPPLSDLNRWFDYYDYDRSGSLDREEVVAALCRTSPFDQRSPQSVRETVYSVWPAFDHDGSGTIDKREFCAPGGLGESLAAMKQQHSQPPQAYQPTANNTQQNVYVPDVFVPSSAQPSSQGAEPYNPYAPSAPSAPPMPSAPPAHSSEPSTTWSCPKCTFANFNSNPRCKMCGTAAPTGVAKQSHQYQQPNSYQQPTYHPPATSYQQPAQNHYQQPHAQNNQQYQTVRVNVPPGTVPGQRLKVRLGGQEHVVTIPDRSKWLPQNPPAFDVQVPAAPTVVVQATPAPAPSSGYHAAAPAPPPAPPKPTRTPWQSWESFRGHRFNEVPLATKHVPSHEVHSGSSSVTASGRRKALLIGINYTGTRAALRGCVNDAKNIKNLLMENGFKDDSTHMVMLTDEGARNSNYLPTGQNIMKGFQWLVQGACEGDVLFFHFSGHGAQVPDKSGMESDGLNETILPLDYKKGQITDDEIWSSIVYPLPSGVKLTAIMDCCHSGTGLDLPFEYKRNQGWIEEVNPAHSKGHVVLFSGCEDSQTSADVMDKYQAGGAMTQSFISAYRQNPMPTYPDLLASLHHHLKRRGFSQRPQLTSSQTFSVKDSVFSFVEGIQPNKNKVVGRIKRRNIKPGSTGHRKSPLDDILFGAAVIGTASLFADALFG